MSNKLTIKHVKEIAMQLYEKGGDTIIECYEDKQIQALIDAQGIDTENKLRNFIQQGYEIDEEYRKAALYHAYGTTDEEKIARSNAKETDLVEQEETEDDYDPCFGCQACDNSYNCKHCIYGDDGRYESPFDVYTPSELGISVRW